MLKTTFNFIKRSEPTLTLFGPVGQAHLKVLGEAASAPDPQPLSIFSKTTALILS